MGGGGPLDGISVSVTGITLEEMDVIKNNVESLGGKFSGFLDEDTTCLIAIKLARKHRAACTHFNIPVVVMQWLEDCNSSGELMQFENYEVPTFHGFDHLLHPGLDRGKIRCSGSWNNMGQYTILICWRMNVPI